MIGIRIGDQFWEIIDELNSEIPGNEIVHDLMNHEVVRNDIDYLELVKLNDEIQISFLPANRKQSAMEKGHDLWESNYRQTGKIGKVLNKVLMYEVKNNSLKEFVEKVQKFYSQNTYEVITVEPKDFAKYYSEESYIASPNSELGKSCMRHPQCQNYFGIYENDPNLEMVVCLRRQRVAARALVWKNVSIVAESDHPMPISSEWLGTDNAKRKFNKTKNLVVLDRVYSVNPIAKQTVLDWAKDNCDLIHIVPKNAMAFKNVKTGDIYDNLLLTHPLEHWKYRAYPYIDTFHFFDIHKGILTNAPSFMVDLKLGGYDFHHTEGEFTRIGRAPRLSEIIQELEFGDLKTKLKTIKLTDYSPYVNYQNLTWAEADPVPDFNLDPEIDF